MPAYYSILTVLTLAWGLFAFGAVYDWAYLPLMACSAVVGLWGLWSPGAVSRPAVHRAVLLGLLLVAAAVVLQLAPLAPARLESLSGATARFLSAFEVGYAVAVGAGEQAYRHGLSINPTATWLGLGCFAAFAILMLGTARALGSASLRALAGGCVVLGPALALAGIVQSGLYARDPNPSLKVYGVWQPINTGSLPFGPLINRNHFAGAMLLLLPVTLGYFSSLVARGMRGVKPTFRDRLLWFSSPDASKVILVGVAAAVMTLSLVLTLSRSGITGLLVALAIAAVFVIRRQARGSRRRVLLAYILLLVVLSLGWAGIDAILARFSTASGAFFGGRLVAWKDAWRIFKDFPFFGTGLNTYGYATLFYQDPTLPRHYVEAHNDYLQLLAEGGLLLALPAALCIFLLGREIRLRFKEGRDDTTTYWLRVGATTGLVAVALQEVVEFSLQIPGIAALFAVIAAIAIHRPAERQHVRRRD